MARNAAADFVESEAVKRNSCPLQPSRPSAASTMSLVPVYTSVNAITASEGTGPFRNKVSTALRSLASYVQPAGSSGTPANAAKNPLCLPLDQNRDFHARAPSRPLRQSSSSEYSFSHSPRSSSSALVSLVMPSSVESRTTTSAGSRNRISVSECVATITCVRRQTRALQERRQP